MKSSLLNLEQTTPKVNNVFTGYGTKKDEKLKNEELVKNKKEEKLTKEDFTTIRLLKSDLTRLRTICSVKGEKSSYAFKMLTILLDEHIERMDDDTRKLFKLLLANAEINN